MDPEPNSRAAVKVCSLFQVIREYVKSLDVHKINIQERGDGGIIAGYLTTPQSKPASDINKGMDIQRDTARSVE
jgi:hypothetical protein